MFDGALTLVDVAFGSSSGHVRAAPAAASSAAVSATGGAHHAAVTGLEQQWEYRATDGLVHGPFSASMIIS